LLKNTALIMNREATVTGGIGRYPVCYLAPAFKKLGRNCAADVLLRASKGTPRPCAILVNDSTLWMRPAYSAAASNLKGASKSLDLKGRKIPIDQGL